MSGFRGVFVGVWLVACGPGSRSPAPESAPPAQDTAPETARHAGPLELREVAPGVHAALQPAATRFRDSNATLVVTEEGVVVIDAPQRVASVQWLREQAARLTDGEARVLVTTHWHLDHSLGGAVWRAARQEQGHAVAHWGHAELMTRLRTDGQAQLEEHREQLARAQQRGEAMQAAGETPGGVALTPEQHEQLATELAEVIAQREALDGVALMMPTHAVTRRTALALGGVTVELLPLRAHTDTDLVAYLPGAGVLITGDVLDELPFGGHGYPRGWLAGLQQLKALDPVVIIPGHGPVMGPERLALMIDLWSILLGQATVAIQSGQSAAARYAEWSKTEEHARLRERLIADPVSERAFAAFIPEALARCVEDLRGNL